MHTKQSVSYKSLVRDTLQLPIATAAVATAACCLAFQVHGLQQVLSVGLDPIHVSTVLHRNCTVPSPVYCAGINHTALYSSQYLLNVLIDAIVQQARHPELVDVQHSRVHIVEHHGVAQLVVGLPVEGLIT